MWSSLNNTLIINTLVSFLIFSLMADFEINCLIWGLCVHHPQKTLMHMVHIRLHSHYSQMRTKSDFFLIFLWRISIFLQSEHDQYDFFYQTQAFSARIAKSDTYLIFFKLTCLNGHTASVRNRSKNLEYTNFGLFQSCTSTHVPSCCFFLLFFESSISWMAENPQMYDSNVRHGLYRY